MSLRAPPSISFGLTSRGLGGRSHRDAWRMWRLNVEKVRRQTYPLQQSPVKPLFVGSSRISSGGTVRQSYEIRPITSENVQIVCNSNSRIAKRYEPDIGASAAK